MLPKIQNKCLGGILMFFFSMQMSAQPSFGVSFHFRLFDNNGKKVEYSAFCTEYHMLGDSDRDDETSCTNKNIPKSYTYNDTTGYFNGSGSVVYGDLIRKFIYRKDTMELIFLTDYDQTKSYKIDSLYVRPGKYVITDANLKSIDFKKAEVDYYNWLLKRASRNRRVKNNELNQLKTKYNIAPGDFTPKKVIDIFKN